MIKLDIINRVADKTGVPKQKAEQVVDALFNAMKEAMAEGNRIETRHRAQPAHRQRSPDSVGQNHPLQTGQGTASQSRQKISCE